MIDSRPLDVATLLPRRQEGGLASCAAAARCDPHVFGDFGQDVFQMNPGDVDDYFFLEYYMEPCQQ